MENYKKKLMSKILIMGDLETKKESSNSDCESTLIHGHLQMFMKKTIFLLSQPNLIDQSANSGVSHQIVQNSRNQQTRQLRHEVRKR